MQRTPVHIYNFTLFDLLSACSSFVNLEKLTIIFCIIRISIRNLIMPKHKHAITIDLIYHVSDLSFVAPSESLMVISINNARLTII